MPHLQWIQRNYNSIHSFGLKSNLGAIAFLTACFSAILPGLLGEECIAAYNSSKVFELIFVLAKIFTAGLVAAAIPYAAEAVVGLILFIIYAIKKIIRQNTDEFMNREFTEISQKNIFYGIFGCVSISIFFFGLVVTLPDISRGFSWESIKASKEAAQALCTQDKTTTP